MIGERYNWERAPHVGEQVEVCSSNQTPNGTRGVVMAVGRFRPGIYSTAHVRFDDGSERHHMSIARFRPIPAPVDLAKVKYTRSGLAVANVEKSGDPSRPILAEVFVDRRWLTLSYLSDGRFVPRFDQPIDLVEAQ